MTKRAYFLISSFILTGAFFLLGLVSYQWKFTGIIGFSVGVGLYQMILFYTMVEKKRNLLASMLLPVFFTLAISLFRFLFGVDWVWQMVLVFVYFFAIYTLFLIENVFLVSLEAKTVPLYRAANTVNLLITLVTTFFIYQVIFSLKLPAWQNALLVFGANFPVLVHFFWGARLIGPFSAENIISSLIFSLIIAEIALSLSFWPLETTRAALYLTSIVYVFLGLAQARWQEKLFRETVREFLYVGLGTFLALFFVTSWR